MNPAPQPACLVLAPARVLLATISVILCATHASAASDTKNGIALYAEVSKNTSGKTTVTCRIVNESTHMVQWGMLKSGGRGFQMKLYDVEGKLMTQETTWAESHAQEGTWNYAHSRGATGSIADPGTRIISFEFDLEDAYGGRVAQGRKLAVSWIGAEGWMVRDKNGIQQNADENGNLVLPPQEAFKFPREWKLLATVPLPLPHGTRDATAPPEADPLLVNPPSVQPLPAVLHEPPPAIPQANAAPASRWWWALLTIPLLLLAWLSLRQRKARCSPQP